MKRISLVLATLTTIVLSSCSLDNSNPSAEDVNYQQTLNKPASNYEEKQVSGGATRTDYYTYSPYCGLDPFYCSKNSRDTCRTGTGTVILTGAPGTAVDHTLYTESDIGVSGSFLSPCKWYIKCGTRPAVPLAQSCRYPNGCTTTAFAGIGADTPCYVWIECVCGNSPCSAWYTTTNIYGVVHSRN